MISDLSIKNIPDDKIEEQLLDRPVSSIYDITYMYGALDVLAIKDAVESDISVNHLAYMTPNNDKVFDMYGNEDSLLTIDLKIDKENKEIKYSGISIEKLTWEKSIKHGYSRPINKAGRMIAHSICQLSSQSGYGLDGCVSKLVDRVGRWPSSDSVQQATKDHKDYWIIESLTNFSENNNVKELIKEDVARCIGKSFTGLFSVRFKCSDSDEWVLPGEMDVMNEGMVKRKENRLPSYSEATDSSGIGTCYVTGDNGDVYGLPPGSPANFFTGKQKGLFWGLEPDNSVNQRPISATTALYLQKGSSILNLFERGITKNDKLTFYPYYNGIWNAEIAKKIYSQIQIARDYTGEEKTSDRLNSILSWWMSEDILLNEDTKNKTGIEILNSLEDDKKKKNIKSKRIYSLIYNEDQNTLYKVLNENTSISSIPTLRLSDSIRSIITKDDFIMPVLDDEYWFNSSAQGDSWSLPKLIFKGELFRQILDIGSIEEDNVEKTLERYEFGMEITGGIKQSYEKLRNSFVNRLIEEQNQKIQNDDIPIPNIVIWKQFLLLLSLSKSELLHHNGETLKIDVEDIINMDLLSQIENREERINEYMKAHNDVINSIEKESAFVLGALIGRLAVYQVTQRELSTTVVDQYPIDSISKPRIKKIYIELTDKLNSYASEEDSMIGLYDGYTDILAENFAESDPKNWETSLEEIRFMYALGLSYGRNDGNF